MPIPSHLTRACAYLLAFAALPGCSNPDTPYRQFDIPSQPAASALNEFARQADITLIFSYDLVNQIETGALHGPHTVASGLDTLLRNTELGYQQVEPRTFSICRGNACGAEPTPPAVRR